MNRNINSSCGENADFLQFLFRFLMANMTVLVLWSTEWINIAKKKKPHYIIVVGSTSGTYENKFRVSAARHIHKTVL